MAFGEVEQGVAGGGEALAVSYFAEAGKDDGLHFFFVEIKGGKWRTGFTPKRCGRAGRVVSAQRPTRSRLAGFPCGNKEEEAKGKTAPTYPSSWLNRVDRRGGQL